MRDEEPQSPDATIDPAADGPPSPTTSSPPALRTRQAHDAVAGLSSAAPSEADDAATPHAEHAEHAEHAPPAAPSAAPAGQSSRLRHGLCPSCFIELPLSGLCDTCD